ncbi:MAG: hypothetical protein FJX48_04285 [Alphaproteobacteria bacterium]|nr:hypothetical protein [Alphaproteobacteria bacterium]
MRRDAERMTDGHRVGRHCERSEAIQNRGAAAGLRRRCAPRNDGLVMALLVSLLLAVPALAAPGSIADCEKIQEADAYNRCLASFGPTRGQHGATYPGMASEGAHGGSGGSAYRPRPRYGGAQASYGRGGRMRMEFTPRGR